MSTICRQIHELFRTQTKYTFPFDIKDIPKNGIYVLYQKDETGHDNDRIVRIGTHRGDNNLANRLKEHFINENKDRSIFRKNIGRSILNKNNDQYLEYWNYDLIDINKKKINYDISKINIDYQKEIEKQISKIIQEQFYFIIIPIANKGDRLYYESRLISTVSLCRECRPSDNWLGNYSPIDKIRESGLWLVNELYKELLNNKDFKYLETLLINKVLYNLDERP